MAYGDRTMQRGQEGQDVEELQIRLAGFRGTLPDGLFGPGTELQVLQFQRDYMKMPVPSGLADAETLLAIENFSARFPLDFARLRCPCGVCGGYGQGRFKGKYRSGFPKEEAFYRFEYPGIHRMILWAVRAVFFYAPEYRFTITSGYRCGIRNQQTGRSSTNHHGKAVDIDIVPRPGEDKRDDMRHCDQVRQIIVERANAQIGWVARNRKALEPSHIAPTWIHYDVRCYEPKYLENRFFCRTLEELDTPAIEEVFV